MPRAGELAAHEVAHHGFGERRTRRQGQLGRPSLQRAGERQEPDVDQECPHRRAQRSWVTVAIISSDAEMTLEFMS